MSGRILAARLKSVMDDHCGVATTVESFSLLKTTRSINVDWTTVISIKLRE